MKPKPVLISLALFLILTNLACGLFGSGSESKEQISSPDQIVTAAPLSDHVDWRS